MKSVAIAFMCLVSAAGCSQRVRGVIVLDAVESHDIVMRAVILESGEPPGYWSGTLAAVQKIKYDVIKV